MKDLEKEIKKIVLIYYRKSLSEIDESFIGLEDLGKGIYFVHFIPKDQYRGMKGGVVNFLIDTKDWSYYAIGSCYGSYDDEMLEKFAHGMRTGKMESRREIIEKMGRLEPSNIREIDEYRQAESVLNGLSLIDDVFNGNSMLVVQDEGEGYELSERQEATRKNVRLRLREKNFLDAYFELVDYFDNYGDDNEGVFYVGEIAAIYKEYLELKVLLGRYSF